VTTTYLAYIPSPSSGVLGHLGPLSALVILIGASAVLVIGGSLWEARGRDRGLIDRSAAWAVPLGLIGVTVVLAYSASSVHRVWRLGPLPIRWYAIFIVVGIIVALLVGDRRWQARGGERGVIYDIALWAVPFGLIGGRLYHVMTDWRTYFGDDGAGLAGALRIWDGGLGIWGAVALGGVGAWIGCRQKGIPLPAFGDAIAPGIILAQAIGRLGNYFNEELYGRPTTLPWGLEIYERRDAHGALDTLNGVSTGQLIEVVHPTFLYELLWNLLIFAALLWLDRRFNIGHGRLFATYVAGYCLGRFWVELMRSDVATHFAGIRVNSFTSTFVFIGAVVYIMVAPKGREDPASLAGKPEDEDEFATFAAKELTAVAATTGVVAAAKAAGDVEDEDADAAVEDAKGETSPAEALSADIAEVPAETVEDAEEFAAEGEEEPEAGLGAVEGEEAAAAIDAVPEVHDAAVEAAAEAEAVADEVTAEAKEAAGDEEPEADGEPEAAEPEAAEREAAEREAAEREAAEREAAEPEAGLGVVEGDEAVDALAAAPEVHEAEVEAAEDEGPAAEAAAEDVAAAPSEDIEEAKEFAGEEAVTVADEEPASEAAAEADALVEDVAEAPSEDIAEAEEFAEAGKEAEQQEAETESKDSEPDESETVDAEAAVEEADAAPSEEEAAEEAEAVAEEADSAAEEEPKTGVLEEVRAEEPLTTDEPEPAEESGGRLSRWLRRNR
jgi:prolipoprotein diacylglyceryl transferase